MSTDVHYQWTLLPPRSSCALASVLWLCCMWLVLHCPPGALCCCCSRPVLLCKPHYSPDFLDCSFSLPPSFIHVLPLACCLSLGRIQAAPCWLAYHFEQLMDCLPEHTITCWSTPTNTILSCYWAVISLHTKNDEKWGSRENFLIGSEKRPSHILATLAHFVSFSTHFIKEFFNFGRRCLMICLCLTGLIMYDFKV